MKKKLLFISGIIAVVCIFAIYIFSKLGSMNETVAPEVLHVTSSEVTIAWTSEKPYRGHVIFQPINSAVSTSLVEPPGISKKHEVIIKGLTPGSYYQYSIGNAGTKYTFQTQPTALMPFTFLMVWGDLERRLQIVVKSELPDFLVTLDSPGEKDGFSAARPYIPLFDMAGLNSPYLDEINAKRYENRKPFRTLDWGGLRLFFIMKTDQSQLARLLNFPSANIRGIVTTTEELGLNESALEKSVINTSSFHQLLHDFNRKNSQSKIDFVSVIGRGNTMFTLDEITYVEIPVHKKATSAGIVRFEIGIETARAVFMDSGKDIMLKEPPLSRERTCADCRRLADMGAYEESIDAYKTFIKNNQGHFQIDDAYFAIANILDEKLFRLEEALDWYQSLVDTYPRGTLTSLARQRIQYIKQYANYHFEPLSQFEQIKKVEFPKKKHNIPELLELFQEVETIIEKYPESKLIPGMMNWLANQSRQIRPEKAIEIFHALAEQFPDDPNAKEVLIDIGHIHYKNKQYDQALVVFQQALKAYPDLEKTITAKINRTHRNIRREWLRVVCWCILIACFVITFFKKPRGMDFRKGKRAFLGFVILGIVMFIGAWLIHEQFTSFTRMIWLSISFALVANLSYFITNSFMDKVFPKRSWVSIILSMLFGIILMMVGFYLGIYYTHVHYLVVAGL